MGYCTAFFAVLSHTGWIEESSFRRETATSAARGIRANTDTIPDH